MLFVENEHNIKHKYINKKRQKRLMPECELFKLRYFKVDLNIFIRRTVYMLFIAAKSVSRIGSNVCVYVPTYNIIFHLNKIWINTSLFHWWIRAFLLKLTIKQIYQIKKYALNWINWNIFFHKFWKHFDKKNPTTMFIHVTTKKRLIWNNESLNNTHCSCVDSLSLLVQYPFFVALLFVWNA